MATVPQTAKRRGLLPSGLPAGQHAAALERRLKAFELRKGGKSYRDIGTALGVSHTQAEKDVGVVLRELQSQSLDVASEYRELQLARLEAMLSGLWPAAEHGHALAVDRVVRLLERQAKLLGLDAPQKFQEVRDPAIQQRAVSLAAETGQPVEAVLAQFDQFAGAAN